jgi:hypothetical protein
MDLGDLFALLDYVEKSGGETLMAGHGVRAVAWVSTAAPRLEPSLPGGPA